MENLIKALQIFLKYTKDEYPTGCEHDSLYVYVDPSIVSEADKKELDTLGFIVCSEYGCFQSFRYGSA